MDERELPERRPLDKPLFTTRDEELEALAQLLRQSAQTLPPEQFRAIARRRLLAKLPARPAPRPSWFAQLLANWQMAQRPLRPALAWAVLALILAAALLVGGGAVYASAEALPDETLYPLKLTVEDAQLWLANAEAEQTRLHLAFADRRLAEMDQLQETAVRENMATAVDRYIYHTEQLQALLTAPTADPAQLERTQQAWDAFVENERRLIAIAQQADPVSLAGLNRAFTATGRGREQAQTSLLNAAANAPAQAQLRLEFAAAHVNLAGNLVEAGRAGDAQQALTSYVEEIEAINLTLAAGEAESAFLVDWAQALAHHEEMLAALAESKSSKPGAAINQAREASQTGRARAQALMTGEDLPSAIPSHAGPPENRPEQGPPDDKPGGGPPDNKPGGGPPDNKPGGGPPEDRPGNRPENDSGED